jgi:hypothetical protein
MPVVLAPAFVAATLLTYSPSCPAHGPSSGQRFEKRAAKGVELYSWKTRANTFRFSLLWGTNRNKTDREIKAPGCTLEDIAGLKAALGRLAKGEHVVWGNELCPKNDCTYPPADVVETLRAHARNVDVTLEPRSPRGEEQAHLGRVPGTVPPNKPLQPTSGAYQSR